MGGMWAACGRHASGAGSERLRTRRRVSRAVAQRASESHKFLSASPKAQVSGSPRLRRVRKGGARDDQRRPLGGDSEGPQFKGAECATYSAGPSLFRMRGRAQPEFGRIGPESTRIPPRVVRRQPNLVEIGPNLAEIGKGDVQVWSKPGQLWKTSSKCGRSVARC